MPKAPPMSSACWPPFPSSPACRNTPARAWAINCARSFRPAEPARILPSASRSGRAPFLGVDGAVGADVEAAALPDRITFPPMASTRRWPTRASPANPGLPAPSGVGFISLLAPFAHRTGPQTARSHLGIQLHLHATHLYLGA